MKDITIAIVGCGAVVNAFYVSAIQKHSHIIKKIFLVDKNIAAAKSIASQIDSGMVIDNYTEILHKVDGVIIALPHFLHYPVAMDFIKNGKHVLCEKPLAESPREITQLINAAQEQNCSISVNNTRRMFPSTREIKKLLSNGKIGKIREVKYIEGENFGWQSSTSFYVDPRASSKGVLLDMGAHALDLVCWWLNEKPRLISYEDDSFGGPESVIHLRAETNSCQIQIHLNRLNTLKSYYVIIGDSGTVKGYPSDWKTIEVINTPGRRKKIVLNAHEKVYSDFVTAIFGNFLDVITKNHRPFVSASDVLNSIELIDSCYRNRSRSIMPWYQNLEALIE